MTPIFVISFIVMAIWFSMQEGEIFHGLAKWYERNTPEKIHKPLFECPICMTPWYGSIYFLIAYGVSWAWPVVILAAMGLNVVIVKLWPED
jgi:hypothetical protein